MRVALYVRRSTDAQEESLETQFELLNAEGRRRGWEVVGRYRDTVSGSVPARERPAFRQLWGAVKRGEVDAVAVVRLDRLTRSGVVDMLRTAEELGEKRVALISLNEPALSTDGPHGKLVLTIMAAVAAYERELLLQRTAEGRERAKARGVKFGPKAKDLDREAILRLRRSGKSWRNIARELGAAPSRVHRIGTKAVSLEA